MNLAWGITGAGHFLKETFDVMNAFVLKHKLNVTTFISAAGVRVVKIYGLWDRLKMISDGGYMREIITEYDDSSGFPSTGRLSKGVYSALIVSPATMNTVAKIVFGIADTVVTNAVALAQKAAVPIFIVPTDQHINPLETKLPYRVDRSVCQNEKCKECPLPAICPAVEVLDGFPHINLTLCQGCGSCVATCSFGAVKVGERLIIHARRIDLENVEKLRNMEGITVLEHPMQIYDAFFSKFRVDSK